APRSPGPPGAEAAVAVECSKSSRPEDESPASVWPASYNGGGVRTRSVILHQEIRMRTALLLASLAGLSLFFPGTARSQEEARAILEKAAKAHGGAEKLARDRAIRTKSKGTLHVAAGFTFTQEVAAQGGRFKEVMDLDANGMPVRITTVFNGE